MKKISVLTTLLLVLLVGCPVPVIPVPPGGGGEGEGEGEGEVSVVVDIRDYFPLVDGMEWESDRFVISGLIDVTLRVKVLYGTQLRISLVPMNGYMQPMGWGGAFGLGSEIGISHIKQDEDYIYRSEGGNGPWDPWFPIKITTNEPLTLSDGTMTIPQLSGDILQIGGYKFLKGHGPSEWKMVNDPRAVQ